MITTVPHLRSDAGSARILLIEDDPLVREVVQGMLEVHGYNVLTADGTLTDFQHALCRAGPIDLLITDTVLRGTFGPALVEKLSKHSPAAKVLYVSGHSEGALIELGYIQNGSNFLQKPFTHEEIGRKVRDILQLRTDS